MESILLIDHANLSRLDLNLLIAFDALLAEEGVTRAAARLGISQPSMSHALSRLRTLFKDELFVRTPNGMRPTPRAMALADPVRLALSVIQGTLQEQGFDPAVAERTFVLGMPDSIEVALLPRLVAHLEVEAPKIHLRVRPVDRFDVPEQLDRDRMHLAISGLLTEGAVHHKRRRLYGVDYLVLYDPAQVPLQPPLALEDYVTIPHVLGSLRGDAHGVVDDALAPLGLRRLVAVATPHFAAVPFVLKGARLLSTVPQPAAGIFAERFGLATSPVPVVLPEVDVSMLWHASYDHDSAHRWLRGIVARLAAVS